MTNTKVGRPRNKELREAVKALFKSNGSYSKTARVLGLKHRQQVYNIVKSELDT